MFVSFNKISKNKQFSKIFLCQISNENPIVVLIDSNFELIGIKYYNHDSLPNIDNIYGVGRNIEDNNLFIIINHTNIQFILPQNKKLGDYYGVFDTNSLKYDYIIGDDKIIKQPKTLTILCDDLAIHQKKAYYLMWNILQDVLIIDIRNIIFLKLLDVLSDISSYKECVFEI